jgi:putative spermidine/putrescine transport system substrate-binding protein
MKHIPVLGTALAVALLFWPHAESLAQSETQKITPESSTDNSKDKPVKDDVKPATDEAKLAADKSPGKLTVASWGGAYSESQKRAYFKPFQDETGIVIKLVTHNGAFETLTTTDESEPPKWDLVDLGPAVLESACASGKLEKVDASSLAAASDGTSAEDDFLPGMLHECGVPSVAWSSAIVYDKRAFKKSVPKTASDFFDVKRFPGKRALPRSPKYTFELALMADGVKPEKVYETLATSSGIKRALKRLDAIKDHVVWWDRAHEPLKLLASKSAAMAIAFNGRIFSAIVAQNRPFALIWDGQIFDLDMWAIPKGSPNKASALELIAFATKPGHLARQARWFPYGPVRKSALKLIGKHPEVDVNMSDYIPTSQSNFKRALRMDAGWWNLHEGEMKEHLKVWRTGNGGSADTGNDAEVENAT